MSRLGEFTVDGGVYVSVGATEADYYIGTNGCTAVGNADFVICSITNGTTQATLRFDCQGQSAGAMKGVGNTNGTTNPKEVVWSLQVGRPLYLPASLWSSSDTSISGRAIASSANTFLFFQFCSWV